MTEKAPYILALDIATTTGVAEGRVGERPHCYSVRFGRDGDEHEDAFGRALIWIANRLKVDRPDWIFVEAPINWGAFIGKIDEETGKIGMSSNPETTVRLIGLWAAVAAAAKAKNIPYRRSKVQAVRKAFLGHGNLRGEIAKPRAKALCKELGWEVKTYDESDAAAVWWHAGTIVSPRFYTPITPMMQAKAASCVPAGAPKAKPVRV